MKTELERHKIVKVHTGAWEFRNGAGCGCEWHECVGNYDGECGYDAPDAVMCPCGCGQRVNTETKVSYAYDMYGYNYGRERNPECLAAHLPPTGYNQSIFDGQEILTNTTLDGYAYTLEHDKADPSIVAPVLYYNNEKVAALGSTELLGEAMAGLHGEMMRHASDIRA